MDGKTNYDSAVFHGDWTRCERLTDAAVQFAVTENPVSIMEIGCGTGEQLVTLARRFPLAKLTGIDISEPNIAIARNLVQREGLGDRIDVIHDDYLTRQLGHFDLIVSYSTLHLIPASDASLFSKLEGELAPGGIFINVIPFDCLFNRTLFLVRRVFRACRGGFTDALIFLAGKLLAGDKLNDEQLREQVIYMYMLPERIEGPEMRKMFTSKYGLKLEKEKLEPHTSVAQPRHLLVVYRKRI